MRWLTRRKVIVAVCLVGVWIIAYLGSVNRTTVRACAGCGQIHRTSFFLGISLGSEILETDLSRTIADRIRQPHAHKWVFMGTTTSNAFRRLTSCALGNGRQYIDLLQEVAFRSIPDSECTNFIIRIEQAHPGDHAAIRKELENFPVSLP
jgi:hypothetical protein